MKKRIEPVAELNAWSLFQTLGGRRLKLGPVFIRVFRALLRVIVEEIEEQVADAARRSQSEEKEIARAGAGQMEAAGRQLRCLRMIDQRLSQGFHRHSIDRCLLPPGKEYGEIPVGFQQTVDAELARWVDDGGK